MLERFEQEDRAVKPNVTLPTYRIDRPRFMGNSIVRLAFINWPSPR